METSPFGTSLFHLTLHGQDCRSLILVNEFPVIDVDFSRCESVSPIINPFLLSGINQLSIQISYVRYRFGSLSTLAGISLDLLEYPKFETPPFYREANRIFEINLEPKEIHQLYIERQERQEQFCARAANVATTYLLAKPISSRQLLENYARHIDQLMASRDITRISTEFIPKIQDYAAALGADEKSVRASFEQVIRDGYLRYGVDIDKEQLLHFHSFACGRVWEICRGSNAFLTSRRDPEGGWYSMKVYVSIVGETLRVVR